MTFLKNKTSDLTCGGLTLFHLCTHRNYSSKYMSFADIVKELKIQGDENLDLTQMMFFLMNNNFNVLLHVKRSDFEKVTVEKDLLPKQQRYVQNLRVIDKQKRLVTVDKVDKELILGKLRNNSFIIPILNADVFSDGTNKGQHIALLKRFEKDHFVFSGKYGDIIMGVDKTLMAMNTTKVKSFVEVIENGF